MPWDKNFEIKFSKSDNRLSGFIKEYYDIPSEEERLKEGIERVGLPGKFIKGAKFNMSIFVDGFVFEKNGMNIVKDFRIKSALISKLEV